MYKRALLLLFAVVLTGHLAYLLIILRSNYSSSVTTTEQAAASPHISSSVAMADTVGKTDPSRRVCVATRVHQQSGAHMPDSAKVLDFIREVSKYSDVIIVCIGSKDLPSVESYKATVEQSIAAESLGEGKSVVLVPVFPWGYFTHSLNVAVTEALDNKCTHIVFQVWR